jgi:hypothetical protein
LVHSLQKAALEKMALKAGRRPNSSKDVYNAAIGWLSRRVGRGEWQIRLGLPIGAIGFGPGLVGGQRTGMRKRTTLSLGKRIAGDALDCVFSARGRFLRYSVGVHWGGRSDGLKGRLGGMKTPRRWVNLTGESFPERRLIETDIRNYPAKAAVCGRDRTNWARRAGHDGVGTTRRAGRVRRAVSQREERETDER